MRKVLTIMFLLLVSFAEAQEYRPMLTDGKEWHCFRRVALSDVDWDPNGEWTYTIKVVGDSLINGVAYKKMCREYTQDVPSGESRCTYFAAIEKDRKVYSYHEEGDVLYLDFSLHEGDCVTGNPEFVVTNEETFEAKNRQYRRLVLNGYVWVEGIGCRNAFEIIPEMGIELAPPYILEDYMVECYDNGELIFTKDDFYNTTTGIENVTAEDQKNADVYSISGVKIAKPEKGMYIQNKRKYIAH
ncbi:hypothetical protein [Leyella stercorea]|uniref:hypothetical protein n=1 Tax=Leyella stercorea TaxID=363265 RepID=UPI001C2BC5E6|nr:hypothetical protein [Leyella stercorea]MBU9947358.1 hypothetical protein [Leyella stercorea]